MSGNLDLVDVFAAADGEPWARLSSGSRRIEVPLAGSADPIAALRAAAAGTAECPGCDKLAAIDFMDACGIASRERENHPDAPGERSQVPSSDHRAAGTSAAYERRAAMAEQHEQVYDWARVGYPTQWIKPYEHTDKNGRTWQKAIVDILPETTVNGVDLTGYKMDVFIKPFNLSDKAMGKPTNLSFPPDKPIDLWKGDGPDRVQIQVMPFDLCHAVKVVRDEYRDQKQAERAANEAEHGDVAKEAASEAITQEPYADGTPLDALEAECGAAADPLSANGLPSIRDLR